MGFSAVEKRASSSCAQKSLCPSGSSVHVRHSLISIRLVSAPGMPAIGSGFSWTSTTASRSSATMLAWAFHASYRQLHDLRYSGCHPDSGLHGEYIHNLEGRLQVADHWWLQQQLAGEITLSTPSWLMYALWLQNCNPSTFWGKKAWYNPVIGFTSSSRVSATMATWYPSSINHYQKETR